MTTGRATPARRMGWWRICASRRRDRVCPTNEAVVAMAADVARAARREIASPAKVRDRLAMPTARKGDAHA